MPCLRGGFAYSASNPFHSGVGRLDDVVKCTQIEKPIRKSASTRWSILLPWLARFTFSIWLNEARSVVQKVNMTVDKSHRRLDVIDIMVTYTIKLRTTSRKLPVRTDDNLCVQLFTK